MLCKVRCERWKGLEQARVPEVREWGYRVPVQDQTKEKKRTKIESAGIDTTVWFG